MLYTGDYIKDSLAKFADQFDADYEKAEYTIEIDGIFRDPPVVKICQFMENAGDKEYQDLMIRHCVLDRGVSILLDGDRVGAFHLNSLNDAWEAIPVFNDHPMAYMALANVVMSYLAKKSTLPRKKTSAPMVAEKTAK